MSEYSRTYESHPELWDDDLSFLAKVEYRNSSQRTIASGWHARQIAFENPVLEFQQDAGIHYIDIGSPNPDAASIWESVERFELEIALTEAHFDEASELVSHFIEQPLARDLVESVKSIIHRVSANRSNTTLHNADGSEIHTVDLLAQNLPARSGDMSEPLRVLYRWCRIFELPKGTLTIYEPLDEEQRKNLRWPHNGVWLNRGADCYRQKTRIGELKTAVEIPIKYEKYNLENWRIEFDFWENQPFQIVISEDSVLAAHRLGVAQKEIGILSQFVTTAFLSIRNLERRSKTNPIILNHPDILEMVNEYIPALKETIAEYRVMLYRASDLLANTAQSVQAVADQKSVEATQRTNTFLTFASAIFFVPTLIISFYSMSIIGLNEGEKVPTSLTVLILCVASVVASLVFAYLVQLINKRIRRKKFVKKKAV